MNTEVSVVREYLSRAVGEAFSVEGAVPSNTYNNSISFDCSGIRLSFYYMPSPQNINEKPRLNWFLDYGHAIGMMSYSIIRSNTQVYFDDHKQIIQLIKKLVCEVYTALGDNAKRFNFAQDDCVLSGWDGL